MPAKAKKLGMIRNVYWERRDNYRKRKVPMNSPTMATISRERKLLTTKKAGREHTIF